MQKLRNIAIIAHVDHGKTTLVDKMIMQSHVLRDNAKNSGELILDNNDLERERGITILSKNVSVIYKDCKINIIDTPGHADFGGEVERVLNMCDGVLLLVDAFEGTMPQTRFVLQKALSLGKKPIVVINKVDKPNCRPEVVNEQVFDLMFSLGATEEQLDYKTIYGSAKQGWMSHVWNQPTDSISPLLDTILDEIPEPAVVEGTPQMLITSLEYSSYIGRIAVGKVTRGELKTGQNVTLAKRDGVTMQKSRIKELMVFEGLGKKKVDAVPCGEICALIGIDGFEIGDTICDYENPEPLPPIAIDEPTMSMLFTINNSPFFGKDGKYVTSRHIKERLDRELEKNLALRVEPGANADSFIRRLPKGYDTVIAEDGGNISQGQKQLLCIARVMLCLPPMLILDEATSSIDTRTEIRVQKAFAKMMEGRTSFIVAHRLSTIREADMILVMRDGHIVEKGKHEELLAKNGFYAEIYNSQFAAVG